MGNIKTLSILGVITVALILITVFNQQGDGKIKGAGGKVLSNLESQINNVTHIKSTRNEGTLTLNLVDGNWVVKERNSYPANMILVRQLLLGLSELKKVEVKTKKPEHYAELDLQDVTEVGSKANQLTIIDGSQGKLADVIIGKSKPGRSSNAKNQYYVRYVDDPQVWLTEGSLPTQWDIQNWLNTQVLKLDRNRIQQVKVVHSDGEEVSVHRKDSTVKAFTLDGLKDDEEIKAEFDVNNIATTFSTITFDNVLSNDVAEIAEDAKPKFVATLKSFDGLQIELKVFTKNDHVLLSKFSASVDEAHAQMNAEAQKAEEESAKGNPQAEDTQAHDPHAKTPIKLKPIEEVKKEAENLQALWKDWYYQIPTFRTDNISRKKADLIKK